jgi:hypothetical protein
MAMTMLAQQRTNGSNDSNNAGATMAAITMAQQYQQPTLTTIKK